MIHLKWGLLLIFTIIVLTINIYSVNARSITNKDYSVFNATYEDKQAKLIKLDKSFNITKKDIDLKITNHVGVGDVEIIINGNDIYEVFNGCSEFGIMGKNKWGCSVFTEVSILGIKIKNATWFNMSWNYRNCFNLTNNYINLSNATYDKSMNTQNLISSGKMLANCNDLRVIDDDTNGTLNYNFTNCNQVDTHVYFKIENSVFNEIKRICYYYGNPLANDNSSLFKDVFLDYDELNDNSIDNAIWNITGDGFTENDEFLNVYNPDPDWSSDFIQSLRRYENPIEIRFEYNRQSSEYFELVYGNLDFHNDFPSNMFNGTRFYIDGVNDRHDFYVMYNGVAVYQASGSASNTGTWYNGTLRINSTYTDMLINGVIDNSFIMPINFSQPLIIAMSSYDQGGTNANVSIKSFIVLRWLVVPPTYSDFEGEQTILPSPPPELNISVVIYSSTDNLYLTNSTCLDNNNLYREWIKTISITQNNITYLANHTEFQVVYCPMGCIDNVNQFGSDCVYPDWQMYMFIISVFVIIIMLALYFKGKR